MIKIVSKQDEFTKIEWIVIILIFACIGSVLVPMHFQSEEKRRHMETVTVPLIEALDRYHETNMSYPDSLQKLIPMYMSELPSCKSQSPKSGMGYHIDKNSGEYYLI